MLASLEKRLEKKLGKNYLQRDFEITSNVNTKRVRGSVRMILGKIYTPKKREDKIKKMLSIKLPR
ncbi:hypothetical protein RZR97_08295 [Hydrogenimonas thermophila]|uniref:hypothetical protein n=1 Tax=Hydrogenimonas thermophila TaxID=223786 RepID=UPI0029371B64|nr:hypothetical protein [Hydrogenimonas thermophila]WOE69107.1 hypothetical protein RZR91_08320 [Hydrogenimonas thermophila]WOE71617.1 hypothetical protein RZR97_08295 [Hydrogenimonas thermophila]